MKNNSKFISISLAIVYIWFGALKVIGQSPVEDLVKGTYPVFPEPLFLIFLGLWEIAIGVFLLNKKTLKLGILLMWAQLGGIFLGAIISPPLYISGMNIFLLNTNGEFVVKNIVFIAATYYLWKEHSKRLNK